MDDIVLETATTSKSEDYDTDNRNKTFHVAIGSKDEESDVAKDEKQDTEKPLMSGGMSITVEDDAEKSKFVEVSTLPLPTRIGKQEAGERETNDEPPSMFFFPFSRIKYTWEHSDNVLQFVTSTICILFACIGWMIFLGGVPLLSIVQLVIGSIYLYDCPAQPMIPEYLIVAGVFGTILHGVAVCTKYFPKDKKHQFEAQRRRCFCIEAILQIFLLIWFIAGCFWVYTLYEPEYKMKDQDNYCNKTLYLFTFWLFNITFFIIILFVTMTICCITLVAIGSPKYQDE